MVDIVHHSLIGGAAFMVAASSEQELVGAAFLAGSVFPDLDVVFMVLGKRFYLRNHQGISHSLPLAPVYALVLSLPLFMLPNVGWDWWIYLAALAGLGVHVTLDWFNTFRIALFSPFSAARYSLDAVFFIDGVALTLTGLFYLLFGFFEWRPMAWLYPLVFASYFLFKLILQRRVTNTIRPMFAIPSSINPFQFFILMDDEHGLSGFLFNALSGNRSAAVRYPGVSTRHLQLAETSALFRDIRRITRAMKILKVSSDEDGTVIEAGDLAVRNFGGRFAHTVLRFDRQGKLVDEVANI